MKATKWAQILKKTQPTQLFWPVSVKNQESAFASELCWAAEAVLVVAETLVGVATCILPNMRALCLR